MITYWLGILIVTVYLGALARVIFYEYRINKLYRAEQDDIKNQNEQNRGRGIVRAVFDKQVEQINKSYKLKISELERKRRFFVGKVAFLKKIR